LNSHEWVIRRAVSKAAVALFLVTVTRINQVEMQVISCVLYDAIDLCAEQS